MQPTLFLKRTVFLLSLTLLMQAGMAQIDYTIFDLSNEFTNTQTDARAIYPAGDGGYFIFGNIGDEFMSDTSKVYIMKKNAVGFTEWITVSGDDDEMNYCYNILQTEQQGYVMVGYHKEGTAFSDPINPMIAVYDEEGNQEYLMYHAWEWDDDAQDVVTDLAGDGFVIIGSTQSYGAGSPSNYNIYMMKTDASGNEVTKTVLDGGYDDFGYAVTHGVGGGYFFAGAYESGESLRDIYLIRTDEDLEVTWTKLIDGTGYDYPYAVVRTNDNCYLVAGQTSSFSSSNDAFLLKVDDAGEVLWHKAYGGDQNDYAFDVVVTQDNHYMVCGRSRSYSSESQIFLLKTDSGGNELWTEIIPHGIGSAATFIDEVEPNQYLLAGYFENDDEEYKALAVDVTDLSIGIGTHSDEPGQIGLSCFPNPAQDHATITFNLRNREEADLQILDLVGNHVLTLFHGIANRGAQAVTFSTSELPAGIYVAVLRAKTGHRACRLVVIH